MTDVGEKMTLAEIRDEQNPLAIRQLLAEEYSYIWISDYWDGPISGLLHLEGRDYWFEQFEENDDTKDSGWYRRYAVIDLPPEKLIEEKEIHRDFMLYVGTHWNCDIPEEERKTRPNELWPQFYEKHGNHKPSFGDCKVIAWFHN